MIALAVVVVFAAIVGGTGPAYQDWRAARRARRQALLDFPAARALPAYLPSAACRGGRCPDPAHCAICKAETSPDL